MPSPKAIKAAENLGLDLNEYAEFINELDSTVEDLLTEAKNGVLESNLKKTADSIHSIKGSVGSLGLTSTHIACQDFESCLKNGINENSMVQLTQLIKIYKDELVEISQGL